MAICNACLFRKFVHQIILHLTATGVVENICTYMYFKLFVTEVPYPFHTITLLLLTRLKRASFEPAIDRKRWT